MNPVHVFVSFDHEFDRERKEWLVSQLELLGFKGWIDESIQHSVDGRWQRHAAEKLDRCQLVLIICGKNTHKAPGVDVEHKMARARTKTVRFLQGRVEGSSYPPDVNEADKQMTRMVPEDIRTLIESFAR